MRRKISFCALLVCCLLAGCGGGTENASNGLGEAGSSAKAAGPGGAGSTAGTAITAIAEGVNGKADELFLVNRPLARSPFAFARNGQFHVFAGNGSQQRLQIDFSPNRYQFWDDQGHSTSGTFSPDFTQPGTYVFEASGTRDKAAISRFRITDDAVVGMFPFPEFQAPQLIKARPFIGVRTLVTNPSELDGTYNRFAMALVYADATAQTGFWGYSVVHQLRISGGGATLDVCRYDRLEYRLDACPAGFRKTHALVRGSKAGFWRLLKDDGSGEQLDFAIARINNQNVYLAAGAVQGRSAGIHDLQLRVGLPDAPGWTTGVVEGPSWKSISGNLALPWNSVAWNSITLGAQESRHAQFTNEGQWHHALSGFSTSPSSPNLKVGGGLPLLGLQVIGQGAGLTVGVVRPLDNVGYPHGNGSFTLALADAAPLVDPRNGSYELSAANGTRHRLSLDFKDGTFRIEDSQAHGETGTFAPDPREEGSYVFSSVRLPSGSTAAKFQPTGNGIVGTFPLPDAGSSPVYNVRPFIAARSFVTDAAQLSEEFTQFTTTRSSAGIIDSGLGATRINAEGTQLFVCNNWTVYAFQACPADTILTYDIVRGDTPGAWVATRTSEPFDRSNFQVARLNGKKVFLRSTVLAAAGSYSFRIGLPATPEFGTGRAYGADTDGASVLGDFKADRYDSVRTKVDGSTDNLSFSLAPYGGPAGLKGGSRYDVPSDKYGALQTAGLGVLLGLRQNVRTQGYMQLMLMNQALLEPFRVHVTLNGSPTTSTGRGSYAAPPGSTINLTTTTDVEWSIFARCSGCSSSPTVATNRQLSFPVNSAVPGFIDVTARKLSTGAYSLLTIEVGPH